MNSELLQTLEECIALLDQMHLLLEEENSEIGTCIQGCLLIEYTKGVERALELTENMKKRLLCLLQEQMAAGLIF